MIATAAAEARDYEAAAPLRSPVEAARFLGISISMLARMRIAGNGPAFIRLGPQKVGYADPDLLDFIAARRRTSTSQT